MDISLLLKMGILVEVKEKNGRVTVGWLDEVGVTQSEGKILIADQRPTMSNTFKGRKIRISDIEYLKPSSDEKANF